MGDLINLADYRRQKEEEDIAYLKSLLDEIIACMPDLEQYGYFVQDQMVYDMPLSSSYTTFDGYYDDE
jgi:hypothetical protein